MVLLGEGAGRRTVALITAMDNPLGDNIGNALEVQEALDVLAGQGDEELIEVSLRVASEMCRLAGVSADTAAVLRSGAGRRKFEEMLAAQGGRLNEKLPVAQHQVAVGSEADGYVEAIDALEVGLVGVELGAGRMRKEDRIDPAAGLVIKAHVGDRVKVGEPLATVHARSVELAKSVAPRLRAAWKLSQKPVQRPPHVLARIDRSSTT